MDTIKITTPAGSPIEITPLSESYARTALQEIDTLVLHYELPEHTDLPLGSTASFRGTTYTLYKTSDLTMHHSRAYEYTATLYGDGERTRLYKVVNLVDGRLSFTLTAKPHEHLQMLVDTLNKREGAGTWTAGSVPDGTEITLAYDHISVLDALVQLATKLETEWGITGTTLHIGKLTGSSDPLSLRYGRGKGILPDIRRTPVDDYPIGRLYANGGSRNIDPSTYGSKTLHFPKGATLTYEGQVYHTDPTGIYVYTEGDAATSSDTSIDLTHIYPSRIGSVTKVEVTNEGAVDILDSTIPETLDYEKQLLEGQTLTVKFETGMLAGREAFGAKYIHSDRRLQIVPRDEDGVTLPGGVYLPKAGDKYAVFGCSLPLEYITDAETAMLSEAVKYLHSHQTEQYNITIELDGIYTKQHWGEIGSRLALGHRVRFTDPSWQPTPVDIRILGITTYLSRPYSPKLDLSNSPLPSSFTAVIKRVEGDQFVREEEYRGGLRRLEKRTYEDAKATREMIERLRVEGFTHSITPETLRTLQAVIGSPSLQFSFGRDDGQELFPFEYEWRKGKTELHIPGRQYILQEKGDKTLSPDAKQKVTEMEEYTYSLKDEETQLYLYADLTSKSYKVSATPMEITDTRLLVALIHGVGEDRTLTPLYGFTEITPGQLKTDLIRSQDGKSYWDLLTGKFATKGDLLIGDPKSNTCLAYIDGVLYVKGLTVNVGSASTTIEDALLEQERKIESAKKVRQPIIKNGTWWVWDDTTNQLIDSGKPAQGATGATGEKGEQGVPGKDGATVRDNLFTAKLYTFAQNDSYGSRCTHLGDGRWRVEKVAKTQRSYFDGASFYVHPIRDTKPGWYTISFRIVETSKPIKYLNTTAVSKEGSTITGDRYISTDDSDNGRLPGFSFYWGETVTKGNEIGDYTIIDQVKIERVAEGEDPMPTAYLPHPLDLKGEPGKDVDPKVLNDLKTAVDDARRKLDDTVTKAELDGVVSAQEERDIQFAKEALNAAMQAYDDAVKRAKELDGEIQVGGRNLAIMSRMIPGYLYGDTKKGNPGDKDYKVIQYKDFIYDPTYYEWEGATPLTFKLHKGGVSAPIIHYHDNDKVFIGWSFDWTERPAGYTRTLTPPAKTAYIRIGFPCADPIVKLERGSVATDWTPAPEDVQAEIDAERAARETAVREVATGLSSANTLIQSLEKAQEMLDTGKLNKADLPDVQYLLDSLKNGATSKKGGLLLTNDIILSDPNSKDVTASMSGTRTRGAKAIRLGIKYSGDHVDYLFNAPFFNAEYNNLTNLEDDNAREKRINELGYSVAEYNKFLRNWRVYPTAEKKEVGETSAFFNDGKAHIGDLFFNGEYISFGTDKDSYMQIGGSAKPESEMVSASTEIRKFGIASRTLTKSGIATLDMFDSRYSNREIKYTANLSVFARAMAYEVPNKGDWDPVHHRYDTPAYRTYESVESSATAQLKLELSRGGSVIKTVTSPEVSVRAVAQGGQFANNEQVPQGKLYADDRKSQAVIITISPSDVRMYDTVTLSLITTARKYCFKLSSSKVDRYAETSASAENIINYLPYDTSTPMVSVTKDKAAFFYGRSKYVLLNYLESCVMKVVGNMIIQGNLTVKGDLKTEGGGFLAGGVISTEGNMHRWVGKRLSVRKVATGRYRITHNIGHTNYCIQAIPVNDTDWNAFVISGTETSSGVEIGVQWNGSWRNGAIHFAIFAQ